MLVRIAAPLAAVSLIAAGCTSADSEPPDDSDGNGGVTDADPAEAPEVNDATLRVNFGEVPENWEPGQEMEGGPLRLVYETLLAPGADGDPEPFLATDYELTPEHLTLHLREGVTFHDGEPFNAEAVAANVEFVRDSPTAWGGTLRPIESVEVVDETTVRLHLDGPTPSLPQLLTTRALPIASPASLEDGTAAEHPVGTSPWAYDPQESVLGTRLLFGAFEDYWGEMPGFANVELYAIEDGEASAAALMSGEIDVSEVEYEVLPRLESTDIEALQYPAIRNNLFFFDRGPGGVFESTELRQAVCTAIDVEQMTNVRGEGEAGTQHFSEGEIGYNPDIDGYPTDLDTARELYAAAGSPNVDVEMVAAPFNSNQIEIFMTQAAEIGDFNVSVQTLPPPEFSAEWNSGRYPLGLAGNDELAPFDWYNAWFAADAPGNPSGLESDELAAAADAAIAAGDTDEADALWAETMKIIADEALTCAHARGVEWIAWNPDVVSGVAAPQELWEPQLINYRDLVPVQE